MPQIDVSNNAFTPTVGAAPVPAATPEPQQMLQQYTPAQQYIDPSQIAGGAVQPEDALTLADVTASVYRSYPVIEQARLQAGVAAGLSLEAYGAYDSKLQAHTLSEPTGYYRNYRQGIGLARQTWWGGYLSAGYRIGRGGFQPWYKERETNEGGEFKLGYAQPLLQGRAIDPQRLAVFQASLASRAAQPQLQQAILDTAHEAATVYWTWIASGATLDAQRELLELATQRGEQFEIGLEAKKFRKVDVIYNRKLIADRATKVLETQQKFQASAFKLSMFLRDDAGQPIVPGYAWLPKHFPIIVPIPPGDFQADLAAALDRRPEPNLLGLELRAVQLDQQLAQNNLLPRIDLIAEGSQDVGVPTSSLNDKGQFQLVVGLQGEVPLQRRKARGKIQSTAAKMSQIMRKIELTENKIGAELQRSYNALGLAANIVTQAETGLQAAIDTLAAYQFGFQYGYADLIYINLLETELNESEIKLVTAQQNWFIALADMQAALGLNPLDQAMQISELPASERAGPGRLPAAETADPQRLLQDWEETRRPAEQP